MNCFEFRKQCLAEPSSTAIEYRRHRGECAACAAFAERQQDFESALRKALQVDVPPGLNARLLLRQTTQHSFWLKRALAYAASLLAVLGIVVAAIWGPRSPDIEELVMGHILDEPENLAAQQEVPVARAAAVLARVGVSLRGNLGRIRFADLCPGGPGVHLVLAGTHGPVTVMIMPATSVSARHALDGRGFIGFVAPAGKGSLAIVGFPGEPIEEHEQRVRAAISLDGLARRAGFAERRVTPAFVQTQHHQQPKETIMNRTSPLIMSTIGGVLALGIASSTAMAQPVTPPEGGEKCYGVVKAGKNDCQTAAGACAGTASKDGQKDAFVYVPKGTCAKIVGGSLKPGKA